MLVALDERNPAAVASTCGGVQGKLDIQGTIDANGKQFDLKLDPKTLVVMKREPE